MTIQKQPAPRSLLLIAYFIFFAMAIPSSTLNVAWTYMQGTYSVGLESLGVLLLFGTFGSLIGTFSSPRLIGRYGMGAYLLGGSVIAAIGLLGYVIAPSWGALLVAQFLASLGLAVYNAGLNIFVSANYTRGQLNWLHACFGVGTTIGPAMTNILVIQMRQTWHVAYLLIAVLVIGITALLLVIRDQWTMPGEVRPGVGQAKAERVSLSESLRVPMVLIGLTTFFTFGGVVWGTAQLSATLLTARGVEQVGFWISLYWASLTVGRIIMGFIANRFDNALIIRGCMVGATFGALLLWQNASTALNLVGLAVIGLAVAPLYPTLIADTGRRVGQRHRTNAISFQMAFSSLGSSIIPGATAWLADHTVVGVIGVLPLIGVLVVLALNEAAIRRQADKGLTFVG